jgi:hypothetical protein
MVELARDARLRRRLGREGRKIVDKVYNYRQFKVLLKGCYEKLVALSLCLMEDLPYLAMA